MTKKQQRRVLEFVNFKTKETSGDVEVTGKSEREIERITRGMLINIHPDWFVRERVDD